jgi:hypothetical protein
MMKSNQSAGEPLAKRVLDRINSEQLAPRPRWRCILQNYLYWGLGIVAVILGAFAFSGIIFEIQNADWQYAVAVHGNALLFFLDAAPVLWVVFLILFLGIGYLNVRKTNHGYRYPVSVITFGAVMTSLALGSALYEKGFGDVIERAVSAALPFHTSLTAEQESWWLSPERGLLGGTVVASAPDARSFELRDFRGSIWRIDSDDLPDADRARLVRGGTVRIVGTPVSASSTVFHACFVFSWQLFGRARQARPPQPVALITATTSRAEKSAGEDTCAYVRNYEELRAIDSEGAP